LIGGAAGRVNIPWLLSPAEFVDCSIALQLLSRYVREAAVLVTFSRFTLFSSIFSFSSPHFYLKQDLSVSLS